MAHNTARTIASALLLCAALPVGLGGCVDCDGKSTIWSMDQDGDGYAVEELLACDPPVGAVEGTLTGPADCDDEDATVYPGAEDGANYCDGLDNDCDGQVDEDTIFDVWYIDADGDGYGLDGTETTLSSCDDTTGYAQQVGDCDDGSADAYPGGEDLICSDGVDGDCDGQETCVLEGEVDLSAVLGDGGGWQVAGASVAVVGDVDGDGLPDVAVGDPSSNTVIFVNGVTGTPIADMSISGDAETDFGTAVAAGDFDEDGAVDLAVGAPGVDAGGDGDTEGLVSIWYGPDFDSGAVTTIKPVEDDIQFGFALTTTPADGESDGLCAADLYLGRDDEHDYYVFCFDAPSAIDTATSVPSMGLFEIDDDWPLTLSAAADGSALAVGYSGGLVPGTQVYGIPYMSGDDVALQFRTTSTSTFLGASLALLDVDGSGNLDLLAGAPGTGVVYALVDPVATSDTYAIADANLIWTADPTTSFGAGIGLLSDLTGASDTTLAIGGADTLWLFRGDSSSGTTTYASTASEATATLTGFAGPVRTILNPGDVNDDGFDDVLVCDGVNVTLLYGGPLPP